MINFEIIKEKRNNNMKMGVDVGIRIDLKFYLKKKIINK